MQTDWLRTSLVFCRRGNTPAKLGLAWLALIAAAGCGNDSRGGPVDPPGPSSPAFEYVRRMISDPWIVESLPASLADPAAAAPIRSVLRTDLRQAVEEEDLASLMSELERLRSAIRAYRESSRFETPDALALAAFELFIAQALAIHEGTVRWTPAHSLQRDRG